MMCHSLKILLYAPSENKQQSELIKGQTRQRLHAGFAFCKSSTRGCCLVLSCLLQHERVKAKKWLKRGCHLVSVLNAVCRILRSGIFKVEISAAFAVELLRAKFISINGVPLSDLISNDDDSGNLVTLAVFTRCKQTRVTQKVKLNSASLKTC